MGAGFVAPVRLALMEAAQQAAAVKVTNPKVSCKSGCSACCRRYVPITLAEAIVIVDFLKATKKWDRVASAATKLRDACAGTKPLSWFKIGLVCPVLNQDNMCDAYQVRPVACSAHFVTSAPETCSPSSASMDRYEPCESVDIHVAFMKAFNASVGLNSSLRLRAPLPLALLVGEKFAVAPGLDFDGMVATIAREFGA